MLMKRWGSHMKKASWLIGCIISVLVTLFTMTSTVQAAVVDTEEISGRILAELPLGDYNRFIDELNRSGEIPPLPPLSANVLKDIVATGPWTYLESLCRGLWEHMLHEFSQHLHILGKLLVLAVLCSILQNMQQSFAGSSIASLTHSLCFMVLIVITITAVTNVIDIAARTVAAMTACMQAVLPLLLLLLGSVGAAGSAATFSPLLLFLVNAVTLVVKDIILPLAFLTTALECISYLSAGYRLTKLSSLFRQGSVVLLSVTLLVFIGLITLQGAAGSIADGVALRTAKYATATFVPVVGKMFADTVELVMGLSLLLKHAIGIAGVCSILVICIWPGVKMFSLIALIKLAGAVIQPLGNEQLATYLDAVGSHLLLVFGSVVTVALMFFFAISILVGTGSLAVMLR